MPQPPPAILLIERAVRDAGIPIDGVSIGDLTDRSTWRAFYQASATSAQRTQGDAILATLDLTDPTLLAEVKSDWATGLTNEDVLIAMAQALYQAIPTPTLTLAQVRANFFTILKARL